MADMTCEHGRLLGACEDCAYEAAQAAGAPLGGPHPAETRAAAEQPVETPKKTATRRAKG